MIELLAPAGDLEKLEFALMYGADAVYIGGQDFSLRANAHNFSLDDIKKGVQLAHNLNKKVYVTVNIVFHEDDLKGLKEYLLKLDEFNVDGIIVSDIVVMKLHKELNLKMELHISTQSSNLNHEATVSKISKEKLFYLTSRGIPLERAKELIIMGFIDKFREELPMEYAVELNALLKKYL